MKTCTIVQPLTLVIVAFLTILPVLSITQKILTSQLPVTKRCYEFPNGKVANRLAYVQDGDLLIGSLLRMTETAPGIQCGTEVHSYTHSLQFAEGIVYAVNRINKDPNILPNITLGFAILDDCSSVNTAIATALAFLPVEFDTDVELNGVSSTNLNRSEAGFNEKSDINHCYDVIGLIGPIRSVDAVSISYLFAVAQLPLVSFTSTSDDLSDRQIHPFFMRLVPPDMYQVKAMVSFIADQGWKYISVLYYKGSYGEKAMDEIKRETTRFGICIATAQKVDVMFTNYTDVIKKLLEFPRARVVILFTYIETVQALFTENRKHGKPGHFIWVGSDGLSEATFEFKDYKDEIHGMFAFIYFGSVVDDFVTYLQTQKINTTKNPWLRKFLQAHTNCNSGDSSDQCEDSKAITELNEFELETSISLVVDSVYTFALAAQRLLADHCPNALGEAARQCIRGDLLLNYMMRSDFNGTTGRIRFDETGALVEKYKIMQYVVVDNEPDSGSALGGSDSSWSSGNMNPGHLTTDSSISGHSSIGQSSDSIGSGISKTSNGHHNNDAGKLSGGQLIERNIAVFDFKTDTIEYRDHIVWSHLNEEERIIPLGADEEKSPIPESVCSRPCTIGEYRVQVDPCCWECRRCRSNEYIGESTCVPCEKFTWPDPDTNYFSCAPIPLSYPKVSDTLPLLLIVLGLIAILCSLAVLAAYFYLREARVIKAASRELSFLQISAILIGYVTVLVFQAPPTHVTCSAQYFLFCFSFSLLYAPMLIKAVRIFRIFQSSKVTNKRPRFVSPLTQIAKVLALVSVQIIVCIIVYTVWQPTAVKIQPLQLERFVELSCDMTLPGLSSFLCYNLVLVTLCSVLAFKTRTLPDNFNESRFTSMCVSTTLVIWLAFIPTYFTATRTVVRVLLLSVALLLNHTVALVFLFIPKIYAAVYLKEEANRTIIQVGQSAKVGPSPTLPETRTGLQPPPSENGSVA